MRALLKVMLPVVVLAAGVFGMVTLVMTKPEPNKTPPKELGAIVEVVEVRSEHQRIDVRAHGRVVPARQVALSSEVAGKVIWVSKSLIPGSRIKTGAKLARIDARDYSLAVQQQFAAVDRAKTELEIEQSRKRIAEREWEMFDGKKKGDSAESLALRDPQLRTAKVAVKSAQSGLRRAHLAVSKTVITAPFNALIMGKKIETGQMVLPGTPLLTLVGTDAYWVEVLVPVARLNWFDIPGVAGATVGAKVNVVQEIGREEVRRTGRVIRLLGEVDPAGRMARLLVEITDPLGLKPPAAVAKETAPTGSRMPLLVGTYASVSIEGRESEDVIAIPREALRDDEFVFVASPDSKLVKKKVDVLWRLQDAVLVASGLANGDRVIVSPVPAPIQGMDLRVTRSAAGSAAGSVEARKEPKGQEQGKAPKGAAL